MKSITRLFLLSIPLLISSYSHGDDKLKQILSELKPELVAPGTISTRQWEYGSSLSPDGNTFAFSKALVQFQQSALVYSEKQNGKWSEPRLFPFSGKWYDSNPYFSKDGKGFYFSSNRPTGDAGKTSTNLWYAPLTDTGFGQPELVKGKINSNFSVIYPTVHTNRDVYFCTNKPGGKGDLDLYLSKWENGSYQEPVAISVLNTKYRDADPELSQDGKLLFYISTKPGGLGHFDLYVSVRQDDGNWGTPIHLGDKLNSRDMDSDPILSFDGHTLFFSSMKMNPELSPHRNPIKTYEELKQRHDNIHNGLMNIYQVDITKLSEYLKANY